MAFEAAAVRVDGLAFHGSDVLLLASQDDFDRDELLLESVQLLGELLHGVDKELICVVKDDDHLLVGELLDG